MAKILKNAQKPVKIESETDEITFLTPSPSEEELVPDENYNDNILEGDNKEKEEVNSRKLPKPPGRTLTFDELMEYLSLLKPEHWNHTICYVYRLFPKIDRTKNNPDNAKNIDKISAPITKSEFVNRHGGGTYRIIVNDTDEGFKGKGKTIIASTVKIDWTQYEPILNYEEVDTTNEDNKPYLTKLIHKGILDGRTMGLVQNGNNSNIEGTALVSLIKDLVNTVSRTKDSQIDMMTRVPQNNGEVSKLLDIIVKEKDKANDILLERLKGMDPEKSMGMMKDMMQMITTANTNGGKDNNGQTLLFQTMIDMIQKNNDRQMQVMEKVIDSLKDNNKTESNGNGIGKEKESPISQMREMIELVDSLREGGSRSAKKSTAEVIVDGIREFAGPVVQTVGGIIAAKMGLGNIPHTSPTSMPSGPMPSGPINENHQIENSETSQVKLLDQAKQFITQYGQLLITHMDRGTRGDEFAQLIVDMLDLSTYYAIRGLGKENILNAAKSVPAFWQRIMIFTEPVVTKFIDDFFDYPNRIEEEEEIKDYQDKEGNTNVN